jgi:type IV pilus assembly protein PilV
MRAHRRRTERGFTLLEGMISLSILAVGLLGMMQLQMLGVWDNQGARAQTVATQLARELAAALVQLPIGDARLTAGRAGASPPAQFGALLGLTPDPKVIAYSDSSAIPGTRLDASLERDPADATQPAFRRRWMVWDYSPTGVTANGVDNTAASKIIAVSVIYHERRANAPDREVVLFTQRANPGMFLGDVAAYR